MTLKIAVAAPMPSPSVTIATDANARSFHTMRSA